MGSYSIEELQSAVRSIGGEVFVLKEPSLQVYTDEQMEDPNQSPSVRDLLDLPPVCFQEMYSERSDSSTLSIFCNNEEETMESDEILDFQEMMGRLSKILTITVPNQRDTVSGLDQQTLSENLNVPSTNFVSEFEQQILNEPPTDVVMEELIENQDNNLNGPPDVYGENLNEEQNNNPNNPPNTSGDANVQQTSNNKFNNSSVDGGIVTRSRKGKNFELLKRQMINVANDDDIDDETDDEDDDEFMVDNSQDSCDEEVVGNNDTDDDDYSSTDDSITDSESDYTDDDFAFLLESDDDGDGGSTEIRTQQSNRDLRSINRSSEKKIESCVTLYNQRPLSKFPITLPKIHRKT
ncbi:protein PFC0760c-like [Panonychus citri]|uniref:protein PFC0760c-like n=1 Tax=Panonychus citri TaxID=50023 RepID=UPI002307E7C5|nr:protein PFC0760c-like [Panonychus citri]